MPETKPHQRFRSRVEYLVTHLDISDSSYRLALQFLKDEGKQKPISEALPINTDRYSHLGHPVSEKERLVNHSRSQNVESSVISLYSHFSEYLEGILAEMYDYDPLTVVGKAVGNHSMKFHEIVKCGGYESICDHMITETFRSLEELRSTKKLLKRILKHTEVEIDDSVEEEALSYLQMRHLFVHNGGVADTHFEKAYGSRFSLTEGDNLPTNFSTAEAAIEATADLCKKIDGKLIENSCVAPVA